MTRASDALLCRVAAGHSQLSSTTLLSDMKQLVIDDALSRMTDVHHAGELAVCFRHLCCPELSTLSMLLMWPQFKQSM